LTLEESQAWIYFCIFFIKKIKNQTRLYGKIERELILEDLSDTLCANIVFKTFENLYTYLIQKSGGCYQGRIGYKQIFLGIQNLLKNAFEEQILVNTDAK
jgi:hypothetical protein